MFMLVHRDIHYRKDIYECMLELKNVMWMLQKCIVNFADVLKNKIISVQSEDMYE